MPARSAWRATTSVHTQRAQQRHSPGIGNVIGAHIGRSRARNECDESIGLGVREAICARLGHKHALDGVSAALALTSARKSKLTSDIRAISMGATLALASASASALARRSAFASSMISQTRKVDAAVDIVVVVVIVVVGGGGGGSGSGGGGRVGGGGSAAAARRIRCRVHGRRRDRHLL